MSEPTWNAEDHCDHHVCDYSDPEHECDDYDDYCTHCECCCTCLGCEYGPRDGMPMYPNGAPWAAEIGADGTLSTGGA